MKILFVMHQTRNGKQSYFGLKAHIGVDSKQGHVHSLCTSAASMADQHMMPDLLHGEERKVTLSLLLMPAAKEHLGAM